MDTEPHPDTDPVYVLSKVAAAADMKVTLLKNWTDREVIIPDLQPSGKGTRAKFSFRSALEIALTARLVEMGQSPLRAIELAGVWTGTRFGKGMSSRLIRLGGDEDGGRDFGGLFPEPHWTIFAFSVGGMEATIEAIDPSATSAAGLFTLFEGVEPAPGVSIVWLNLVHARVTKVLRG